MKITLKTVKGQQIPFDVEPDMTVGQLKEKICSELQTPAELQKILHKGAQLEDNAKTLGAYKVADNDFLVLFVTKPV